MKKTNSDNKVTKSPSTKTYINQPESRGISFVNIKNNAPERVLVSRKLRELPKLKKYKPIKETTFARSKSIKTIKDIVKKMSVSNNNIEYTSQILIQDQEFDSLVVVYPSGHSNTMKNTYLQNYIEFVEDQKKKYNDFIDLIVSHSASQLTKSDYVEVSVNDFVKLFDEKSSAFISAVSQGVCSLASSNSDPKNYTPDAKRLSNIYTLSKSMLQKIEDQYRIEKQYNKENKYKIDSNIIKDYITNLKRALRRDDYERYKNILFTAYNWNVQRIIDDLEYILELFDFLEEHYSGIKQTYSVEINTINNIYKYFVQLKENIKDANVKEGFEIPTVGQIQVTDPRTGENIYIDNDIDCIDILSAIIDKMSNDFNQDIINSDDKLGNSQDNPDNVDDLTAINNRYKIYLNDFHVFGITLDLTDLNDNDNNSLILKDLVENVFWQIEKPIPDYNHDISMSLKPNKGECLNQFDCQYGINIMAAASLIGNELNLFNFKPFRMLTRGMYKEQKTYSKNEGFSGPEVFKDETWRNLGIQNFLDSFLDMFLNTHIESKNRENAKMIISIYMTEEQSELTNLNITSVELSRLYDFCVILKHMMIDEEIYMSILKYYLQYLIGFEYAIYELPSCRVLQDKRLNYTIPQRTTSIHPITKEQGQKYLNWGGGTKSKKRKYNKKKSKKRKTKRLQKHRSVKRL
jgi:hypothetical protein